MKIRKRVANSTTIIANLTNKDGDRAVSANMSALLHFGEEFAHRMTSAMESFSRTRAYPTQVYALQIQRWGLCISDNDINISDYDLTNPDHLDELHLIYLEWFFTKNPATNKSNLETLKRHWTNQGNFIRFCQDSKILPTWDWFSFPKQRNPAPLDHKKDSELNIIGLHQRDKSGKFFQKIAASKALSISSHDNVFELKEQLKNNLKRLENFAITEIDKLISEHEAGEVLAKEADVEILEKLTPGGPPNGFIIDLGAKTIQNQKTINAVTKNIGTAPKKQGELHIFSPRNKNGYKNLIWWVKKHYGGYYPRDYISNKGAFDHEEMKTIIRYPSNKIKSNLGTITHNNLIPFILLLFCKHREISNLSPVLHLSIDDITPVNNGLDRISVDKRRAHSIKSAILDPEVKHKLEFLKNRTDRYRQEITKTQGRSIRSLFIGLKSDTYAGIPRELKNTSWAGKLLKKILKSNQDLADLHNVTFSSIRNTHSVISYIESEGDWHHVARSLGHSVQTAMRHYIPQQLTTLLREHKARQHQNEMLIVASYGQPFDLLDAVDFRTNEEIDAFLTNILRIDSNRTDVLLLELDRMIKQTSTPNLSEHQISETCPTKIAHIALSVEGLSALFRYENQIEARESLAEDNLSFRGGLSSFWRHLSAGLKTLLNAESYPNEEHIAIFKKALAISSSI